MARKPKTWYTETDAMCKECGKWKTIQGNFVRLKGRSTPIATTCNECRKKKKDTKEVATHCVNGAECWHAKNGAGGPQKLRRDLVKGGEDLCERCQKDVPDASMERLLMSFTDHL